MPPAGPPRSPWSRSGPGSAAGPARVGPPPGDPPPGGTAARVSAAVRAGAALALAGLGLAITLLTIIPLPQPRPRPHPVEPPGQAGQPRPPADPAADPPADPAADPAARPAIRPAAIRPAAARPVASRAAPDRATAGAAMCWAPGVGLLLGAGAAGVLWLAGQAGHTGPVLAAALATAFLAVATGGLHLDGLADLADGLGSRRPADAALEIMKRSDTGPMGVAALVLTLLIQVTALAAAVTAGHGFVAVAAAAVTARLAITACCVRGIRPARP
ncbi:MAG TPA: adenosylcobinamide-GDP ribazoletransferase, partial [Streptosporangiaceae bacterium]